jgi:glycosyltransferase involved in cell wall biosynthesis
MNDIVTPLFSVVIPTYNHASYLGRALQSVLDQTYTKWEAIVIDNHSTDKTDEVMTSFADPRIIYLKIQNNGVIAASRNAGIRAAKGEWIAFLDSDDWWTADKLEVCIDCINAKVDLVYHDLEIIRDPPVLFSRQYIQARKLKKPVLIDLLANGNAINTASTVVRKELLRQINGMSESPDMIAAEDYNTWLRIAQITDQFVYLPRRYGYYLNHNQSVSKKDMSIPVQHAVAEFVHLLDGKQKTKLESRLRYTKGRFNYLSGNYAEAKQNLSFCLYHGKTVLKAKSIFMLAAMVWDKLCG